MIRRESCHVTQKILGILKNYHPRDLHSLTHKMIADSKKTLINLLKMFTHFNKNVRQTKNVHELKKMFPNIKRRTSIKKKFIIFQKMCKKLTFLENSEDFHELVKMFLNLKTVKIK